MSQGSTNVNNKSPVLVVAPTHSVQGPNIAHQASAWSVLNSDGQEVDRCSSFGEALARAQALALAAQKQIK